MHRLYCQVKYFGYILDTFRIIFSHVENFIGKKTASETYNKESYNENNQSFLDKRDSFIESSMIKSKNSNIIEKESTSFNLEDSLLNNNKTYSTTLNTQVKAAPSTNGFKEESFLIKATAKST